MSKRQNFERAVYDVAWVVKQLEERLDNLRYRQSQHAIENDQENVDYTQHQITELVSLLYKVNTLC